jgi:hypothetical protein
MIIRNACTKLESLNVLITCAKKFQLGFNLKIEMPKLGSEPFQLKGQLISKCPFGVIVSTKIPTKKFDNFCLRI